MDTDDDFWGIETAIASKQTPFAVGSWIGMVSGVEGRDKFLKIVQFYAKYMKYQRESDSKEAAAAWGGLMTSVQEGRKSVRWLKGGAHHLFAGSLTQVRAYLGRGAPKLST